METFHFIFITRKIFNFDIENFDFDTYLSNWVIGIRRYIMKEPDETIEAARRKIKVFLFMDFIIKLIFIVIVFKFAFYTLQSI